MDAFSSPPTPTKALAGPSREARLCGVLLGTAVGDALGLPREGLSPAQAERWYGPPPYRHRFFFGRGMVSDDTEHARMVGQSLLATEDAAHFARALAWRLRGWLLTLPAGIGWATLRALVKLWLGFSPARSGVRSAGNGPAMRAPLLGACLAHTPERLPAYLRASTTLTHRDPRAEEGALLLGLAAAYAARSDPAQFDPLSCLDSLLPEIHAPALVDALAQVRAHLLRGAPPAALAAALGLSGGVSGYIVHTAPVALYVWLLHWEDPARALTEILALGGDTDSTAAVVGGLCGALLGEEAIPAAWRAGLWEWPCGVSWMRALGARLARRFPAQGEGERVGPLFWWWPVAPLRGLLFLAVALWHGLRRFV